ncbi:cadherin EGF LAG seven-pass G-type receptor 3-like isoform X2 [Cricetulus griseus]|uniref:cadherin EGF LAG seven-pass G-type receptor 3-like isoform X2 n=1 Tax=Cricetulus griseus TaxID=10029 RepID=UPI000F73B13B|nr:cadherin EGF LAG seven-pass G-type receptor 3-like isoform X2 [Cricetulus griseus]XP_035294421.1 cadherin EGF LAG seven-pass G-type receptor 3-like isoform X2 [Cricetulus griseus]
MELTYLNPVGLVTPNIMLSIDRMEHPSSSQGARRYPRYHSNLFRGQDAWDPHTHVLLPSQSPQPSPSEVLPTSTNTENATASSVVSSPAPLEPEPEPGMSIVILLVYRTLGGLLPAQFQAERRGARLPQNPVMNSPVVSVAVFHGRNFLRGVLVSPINLEFRLLQTANRSKAICVQWDPPGPTDQHGMWTARDCELVHRNGSHAQCRCSRTGTFGVLMDASPRERLEGDLELLAVFTHVAVAVSVTALVLTAAVLLSLRSLKSNVRGIHANVAAALGVAELVFLLGIHRTHNQLLCTAVAILLHYFFLSTFAWLLVQGLHLYRMQVEPRNVDRGAMRFYHALGWGVPAVLLGLAVGLDPDGYGNPDFCWISIHEPLIWSFAGPIILVIVVSGRGALGATCELHSLGRGRRLGASDGEVVRRHPGPLPTHVWSQSELPLSRHGCGGGVSGVKDLAMPPASVSISLCRCHNPSQRLSISDSRVIFRFFCLFPLPSHFLSLHVWACGLGLFLSLTVSVSLSPLHLTVGVDEWDHVSPRCPHLLLHRAEGGQEDLCAVSWLVEGSRGPQDGRLLLGGVWWRLGSKFCMKESPSCLGLWSLSGNFRHILASHVLSLLSPNPLGLPGFFYDLSDSLYPTFTCLPIFCCLSWLLTPLSFPWSFMAP